MDDPGNKAQIQRFLICFDHGNYNSCLAYILLDSNDEDTDTPSINMLVMPRQRDNDPRYPSTLYLRISEDPEVGIEVSFCEPNDDTEFGVISCLKQFVGKSNVNDIPRSVKNSLHLVECSMTDNELVFNYKNHQLTVRQALTAFIQHVMEELKSDLVDCVHEFYVCQCLPVECHDRAIEVYRKVWEECISDTDNSTLVHFQVIQEPLAACLHSILPDEFQTVEEVCDKLKTVENMTLLTIDIGHGTADASAVRIEQVPDQPEVLPHITLLGAACSHEAAGIAYSKAVEKGWLDFAKLLKSTKKKRRLDNVTGYDAAMLESLRSYMKKPVNLDRIKCHIGDTIKGKTLPLEKDMAINRVIYPAETRMAWRDRHPDVMSIPGDVLHSWFKGPSDKLENFLTKFRDDVAYDKDTFKVYRVGGGVKGYGVISLISKVFDTVAWAGKDEVTGVARGGVKLIHYLYRMKIAASRPLPEMMDVPIVIVDDDLAADIVADLADDLADDPIHNPVTGEPVGEAEGPAAEPSGPNILLPVFTTKLGYVYSDARNPRKKYTYVLVDGSVQLPYTIRSPQKQFGYKAEFDATKGKWFMDNIIVQGMDLEHDKLVSEYKRSSIISYKVLSECNRNPNDVPFNIELTISLDHRVTVKSWFQDDDATEAQINIHDDSDKNRVEWNPAMD